MMTRLLVFCLICSNLPSLQGEDWPNWRGPRGDSSWNNPPLAETFPEAGLKSLWKKPIGGGYGGIAVVGERLYVMDRQKEPAEIERILCYAVETGAELWQVSYPCPYKGLDYGNGPRVTPTVHEGRVYTIGAFGHAYCLAAETGKVLWQKDPVRDYVVDLPIWGVSASPVIHEDLVILHPGAKEQGCVIAFDKVTGKEVWRAGNDPGGYSTPVVIQSPSGPQLICWTPEHIWGLHPRTGAAFWNVPYKVTYGVSIATPIYYENTVLVSGYWEGTKAIQLGEQPSDAKLLWEENKWLRGLMAPPLYRAGVVYLLDRQHGLIGFELATGTKLWDDKHELTPRDRNPQANLVWLDGGKSDRVIGMNADGDLKLARINREGYHETAKANIIGFTWAHPAFAGNRVFARSDTELVAVELPTP